MNPIKFLKFSASRRTAAGKRGVAAMELAMALPLLMLLLVGGMDMTRYMLLHQKVERVAYSVADIVAQAQTLTGGDLNQILLAGDEIMNPFLFGPDGIIIVSSIYKDQNQVNPITRWRYSGGGTLPRFSKLGNVGSAASLPNGLTLNDRDNIIIAEVYYEFSPLFSADIVGDGDIYKLAVFKPRLGALITPPTPASGTGQGGGFVPSGGSS